MSESKIPRMCKKQAVAAAVLIERTRRPMSRAALDRLSAFAAQQGLFEKAEEGDDWADYETRCRIEREQDPVVPQHRVSPLDAMRLVQDDNIKERARIVALTDPNYLLREAKKASKEKTADPTSVDWKDPADEGRTKLHKYVLDNSLREIKHYVENLGANPGIRDNNGHSPLQVAINEGYLEIARYLKDAFRTHIDAQKFNAMRIA